MTFYVIFFTIYKQRDCVKLVNANAKNAKGNVITFSDLCVFIDLIKYYGICILWV